MLCESESSSTLMAYLKPRPVLYIVDLTNSLFIVINLTVIINALQIYYAINVWHALS